jgi:hypothetical protein
MTSNRSADLQPLTKINRLTLIEVVGIIEAYGTTHTASLFLCDCGATCLKRPIDVINGHVKSCGCAKVAAAQRAGYKRTLPYGVSALRQLFSAYKKCAARRKKDIAFALTLEQFAALTKGNCQYCGREPAQVYLPQYANGGYVYNGIDRVDSDKGYTPDNCVSCCKACNVMKNVTGASDFLDNVVRIAEHQKAKGKE